MKSDSEAKLPARVLKWVVNSVDSQATIHSVRQLHGGTSSSVHSILLKKNQVKKDFVLRQFDNALWLQNEPDLALHEAESLRLASRTDLKTPQLVAFDETGIPAVLMTRLEGTVILRPKNMERWLNGLAETLVRIHAVKADTFQWTYASYNDITSMEIPSWSSAPERWKVAIDIVKGSRPEFNSCFIHRDYHPANILWKENAVSGVVDWVNACKGPAGIDVGHCRVNLAMLYDVPTADAFLFAYQNQARKSFNYDSFWDILSLIDILTGPPQVYPGWEAFGVSGLTDKLMKERIDRYLVSLLERFNTKRN